MSVSKEMLETVRNQYGEAFYLLDSVQFRNNFAELKDAFGSIYPNFNIAYSYKTNYTPKLCRIVNELGGYAEVVSEMELELAQKIGVTPDRVIWNGPVKNRGVLEQFLISGGMANIDSLSEAEFIRDCAISHPDEQINVGLRCNYDVGDGVISRFGFDIDGDDFQAALEIIKTTPNIHLISLQCHFAKRQLEYWPARAKGMTDLIDRIGIIPERIDIGGGLYGKMEDSLKKQFSAQIPAYSEYAAAAAEVFADKFSMKDMKPELIIEPGSALVGDCMAFVGIVKTIKQIRGKAYATVLGSQKNISMAGVNPPMEVIEIGKDRKYFSNIDLVGYTCIEGDVIYKDYEGTLASGDMIVLGNCGSYSLVMKPPFILPNFPVLDISEGKIDLVKKAETFDDIFHTFVF